jgi:hypothetical protein
MSRRRLIQFAACAVVLCSPLAAQPLLAQAGTYQVRSCFPDGIDTVWNSFRNNGFAAAYKQCPQGVNGSRGLIARNVLTQTPAPGFSFAKLYVNAPAGTYIDEIHFDASIVTNRGWQAGLYDRQHGRWVWCGLSCNTFGYWFPFHLGLATSSLEALVICGAAQCDSDGREAGSIAMRNVTLRLRDVWNPSVSIIGGTLAKSGWKRGVQSVQVAGSDNAGIASLNVLVNGIRRNAQVMSCDDHRLVPCPTSSVAALTVGLGELPDGPHIAQIQAVDASGNVTPTTRTILVDNTPPDPVLNLSTRGGEWQSTNGFTLEWDNPSPDGNAPISGAAYQICRLSTRSEPACGPVLRSARSGIAALEKIGVPAPGAWQARLWLIDAAGNQSAQTSREVALRWDPDPPLIKLRGRNEHDPTRIIVDASDSVSGLASTEIEMRRRGDSTWHSLPVERATGGFTSVVDDESFPPGTYAIRARARDRAGNEQSTEGSPMSITLPLRLPTELKVGRSKRVRAGSRRDRRALIGNPRTRYGRTMTLSGWLTSPGGNPVVERDIEISQRLKLPGATWTPVASVRTNRLGRFRFRAPSGPNRYLRFRYAGTPTVRGVTSIVELRVAAASGLVVNRHHVVNGDQVVFRGRVRGEPIPRIGKLLQLQVFSRGHWLTFATPRANARGLWRYPYRFTATRGETRYRFRVRLPREAGYPYEPGVSRTVRVKVSGL